MVKLLKHGVYLAGNEIVEDLPGAAEALSSKTGQAIPSKEEAAKSTMAYEILQAHNTSGNPEKLKVKFDCLISQTGYTGEPLGYEVYVESGESAWLWNRLIELGAKPAGLGARDTLRMEACLPLYGHEMGADPEGKEIPVFAVPLAILGARLYYIIFYLDRYRIAGGGLDFAAMVRIWDGGLAIYGGVIAAALTLLVFCKVRKIKFLAFADLGVFGLLIGQSVGRWGNFVNVEAYGSVTGLPWRMCSESIANELWRKGLLESQEMYQSMLDGTLGVHPTFFYESMWNLIGFLLLQKQSKKRMTGRQ